MAWIVGLTGKDRAIFGQRILPRFALNKPDWKLRGLDGRIVILACCKVLLWRVLWSAQVTLQVGYDGGRASWKRLGSGRLVDESHLLCRPLAFCLTCEAGRGRAWGKLSVYFLLWLKGPLTLTQAIHTRWHLLIDHLRVHHTFPLPTYLE